MIECIWMYLFFEFVADKDMKEVVGGCINCHQSLSVCAQQFLLLQGGLYLSSFPKTWSLELIQICSHLDCILSTRLYNLGMCMADHLFRRAHNSLSPCCMWRVSGRMVALETGSLNGLLPEDLGEEGSNCSVFTFVETLQ